MKIKKITSLFLFLILFVESSVFAELLTSTIPQQETQQNVTDANFIVIKSSISHNKAGMTYDTGEFYRVGNRKIQLLRSLEKVAIRHADDKGEAIRRRLESITETTKQFTVASELAKEQMLVLHVSNVSSPDELQETMDQLRLEVDVNQVVPVYINQESRLEMIPTEQFIVKLAERNTVEQVEAINNLTDAVMVRPLWGTTDQFIFSIPGCTPEELLAALELYTNHPSVEWASPDFICQAAKCDATPNDTYYSQQWHLKNTGQSGGTYGADINAPSAWNITTGNSQIVIAIIDDGIDLMHEDLKDNLWNGWDFYDDDNDPSHSDYDYHGTMVAGVAAAKGNNNKGVVGCAFGCRLMPLKIYEEGGYFLPSDGAAAIRYAAGFAKNGIDRWRGADVINLSWSYSESSVISSALHDAAEKGRNGKGCPIFCASSNEASGWVQVLGDFPFIPSRNYSFKWEYIKDYSTARGDDAAWLDSVIFPGGELETFENGIPSGWITGGNAPWYSVQDGQNGNQAMTGIGGPGSRSVRSGSINDNGYSYLQVTKPARAGTFSFWCWTSSEYGCDGLLLYIDGTVRWGISGVPHITTSVAYPASHPDTIAVGASTDFDYRADYSCYGSNLDFVAPSGGGLGGIWTTAPTGTSGEDAGNYYSGFAGTSASSPLAAGVAALMLSKNPNLTATRVREIMCFTCDKVGSVEYINGRNDYYGYGRINAKKALDAAITPSVLVCGADSADRLADIQRKLLGTGRFTDVDVLDVHGTTPALADLQAYDAMLVYSSEIYQDSNALGNVMADYVDGGGGVVCMMFESGHSLGSAYMMQGRWNSGEYYAIPRGGHYAGTQATLGNVLDSEHPIMQGVAAFDGGPSSFRPAAVDVSPGSVRIADWSDGKPLVVTKLIGTTRRVDLGFYPVSSDVNDAYWNASTDGALLMANALTWVDRIELNEPPIVWRFAINNGNAQTASQTVTLDSICSFSPTHYMASESLNFTEVLWQPYSTSPSFILSSGDGTKTVYFKAKNSLGESTVIHDTIFVTVGAQPLFHEDFEDGDISGWTAGAGTYTRQVTSETAAAGTTRSFTLIGGSGRPYDGVSHDLASIKPNIVTFYTRSSANNKANGYFVVGTGADNSQTAVFFYNRSNGQMGIYDGTQFWGTPYESNTWYKIELIFNWTLKQVDFYVNDNLVQSGIKFRGAGMTSLTKLYLYNFTSSQVWWDEIDFR